MTRYCLWDYQKFHLLYDITYFISNVENNESVYVLFRNATSINLNPMGNNFSNCVTFDTYLFLD